MGHSQDGCIDSKEALNAQNGPKTQVNSPSLITEDDFEGNKLESRTACRNMIWELGLACFLPVNRRQIRREDKEEGDKSNGDCLEHNKAWLLAEAGNRGAQFSNGDPQSVHSSFRFSFGSQVELESLSLNTTSPAATVLMVNLDSGLRDGAATESRSRDLKWRRIESLERSISPVAATLVRFSYGEIRHATKNFCRGRVLGRGALSCVFRGRVGFRRIAVAIKRLDKEDKESAKAFCRELMIASSLHHRNVVPLVGFCIDAEEGLFLVYKFASGGSLEHHLHGKKRIKGCSSLPWSVRFKVATGIAEAIAYLHNGTERCVVHRDIKPSNILLSSKKNPKLCDFGLATCTPAPSVPFLCKTVKGTFGYLAPEYFQHGKVSDKTDVYAFGVVLLELITGRKPIEAKRPPGDENLVLWAKPLLDQGRGGIEELLDPLLRFKPNNSSQITQMVQAAAVCVNTEESKRPSICEIVAILQGQEHYCHIKNRSSFAANGCILDFYPHLQRTKSEIKNHLALAMLGVSELEDEDHLYCR